MLGLPDERSMSLNPAWVRAREIMGHHFLDIEEVTKHFGVNPTPWEFSALSEIPFSESTLEECKRTHLLVAGYPMTMLDVREKAEKVTFRGDARDNSMEFVARKSVGLRWYLIRKGILPNSTSKVGGELKELLGPKNEIPHACELVYAIVLYYLVAGEELGFPNGFVRCVDSELHGNWVYVGFNGGFVEYGVLVDRHTARLGVASARKSEVLPNLEILDI